MLEEGARGRPDFALHVSYFAVYLDVEDVREYCEYYTIYSDDLLLHSCCIELKSRRDATVAT